uniref:Phytocyanin domain-containing protein n=1 Tax=Leersia perrieri TaxID=77586 RepID=A0A0D9X911_9ORYZ
MASPSALIAMLVVVGCAAAASAMEMNFYVGDAKGWTTGVNYTAWAIGKQFEANDTLIFRQPGRDHTVTEVTKSEYDACAVSGNPIFDGRALLVTISLSPGTQYFICTVGNHCASGMKLAVTVSNSSDAPRAQPWFPPRGSSTPTGAASARLHSGGVVVAAAIGVIGNAPIERIRFDFGVLVMIEELAMRDKNLVRSTMASYSVMIMLLLVVGCAMVASAETEFRVGDEKGWTTGVDYAAWANGKNFAANDTLREEHTVIEVRKSDYDACAGSGTPTSDSQAFYKSVSLRPGTHYFICTVSTHCANGMKLAVTVSNSSSGPMFRPSNVPYPYPPPAGSSATRLQVGAFVVATAGIFFKLALF